MNDRIKSPETTTASSDTKWLDDRWLEIREYTDAALQLVGSMPIAIHNVETDPEHIQELLIKLSDALTALSHHVGERRPGTEFPWNKAPGKQAEAAEPTRYWMTMQCEKCSRQVQIDCQDIGPDNQYACPHHAPGQTYWLHAVDPCETEAAE